MSLDRYDDAIKNYSLAVKYDPNNGNRYYDLGFAIAANEKLAESMKNLAKAEELGCIPENLVQLTTENLYTQLEGTVNGLIPGNFSGSAADGLSIFSKIPLRLPLLKV